MFQSFLASARQLTPIRKNDKAPLLSDWPNRRLPDAEIAQYAADGHALGWVLGPLDLVVDVDPRNGGWQGLKTLSQDYINRAGDTLRSAYPVVITGGDGRHIYMRLPAPARISTHVARYGNGIEFKTAGAQVLIPGSPHPSGARYQWDDATPYGLPPALAPQWLIDLITRPERAATTTIRPRGEILTADQLAMCLAQLPIADYAFNDAWLPIMMAAHAATGGSLEACEVFLDWTAGIPGYDRHDKDRARWDSCEVIDDGITVATLYAEINRIGGVLPGRSPAERLRAVPDLDDDDEDTDDAPARPAVRVSASAERLAGQIDALTAEATPADIRPLAEQIAHADPLTRDALIAQLAKTTGATKKTIRAAVDAEARRLTPHAGAEDDPGARVAAIVLAKHAGGDHLIHAADQRYWRYNGTHWEIFPDNMVKAELLEAAKRVIDTTDNNLSALMAQGDRVLVGSVAREVDFNVPPPGQSIVNTLSGEIVIDNVTGDAQLLPHRPASRLTSCLQIQYDPAATAPRYAAYLREVFAPVPDVDRQAVIDTLMEAHGYTLQARKNVAMWVLLKGDGANGKTVDLNIMSALLGPAALNMGLAELDPARNAHAFASLPGKLAIVDEDLDAGSVLPDGFLKKVSENKRLTANPKFHPTFDFENTATVWMASNDWPKIKDVAHGMRRRALVFRFDRCFADHEQDHDLARYIIDRELSGVLNMFLAGLKRLRVRGNFDRCAHMRESVQLWECGANPLALYVSTALIASPNARPLSLSDTYDHYLQWLRANGLTHNLSKHKFSESMRSLGVDVTIGAHNARIVCGRVFADNRPTPAGALSGVDYDRIDDK